MAPLRNHSHCLVLALTLAFLVFLSTQPVESRQGPEERKKMVLGSKPPGCVNKCSDCKPCMATLVVPSHQRKQKTPSIHGGDHGDDDDSYYLLSWKCKCGNKLYHP